METASSNSCCVLRRFRDITGFLLKLSFSIPQPYFTGNLDMFPLVQIVDVGEPKCEDSRLINYLYYRAMHVMLGIAIVSRPSICPSVCLFVTLMYRGRMCWVSSKIITRIISLGSSLLAASTSAIYSKGNTPKIRVALLIRKPAISLKRGKIGPRLLFMTNKKSHARFRLVPKLTTLDDLEGPLCTLFQNTCMFRSPPRKSE